ncbi:hypothetical protein O1L60_24575 [Streptomyces diastatochromogenes]|nr:hypothetical protein [Streptomyces diastatochromogenes]
MTVVGSGQAALETAALLVERGAAAVRVVARADRLYWNALPLPSTAASCPHCAPRTRASAAAGGTSCTRTPRDLPAPSGRRPAADPRLGARPGGRLVAPRAVRGGRRRPAAAADRLGGGDRGRAAPARRDGTGGTTVLETDHVIAATGFVPSLDRAGVLSPRCAGRSAGSARAAPRGRGPLRVLLAGPVPRGAAHRPFVRAVDAVRPRRRVHGGAPGEGGPAAAAFGRRGGTAVRPRTGGKAPVGA